MFSKISNSAVMSSKYPSWRILHSFSCQEKRAFSYNVHRLYSLCIFWLSAVLISMSTAYAAGLTGGVVSSGSGSIVQNGNQTTITQNSAKMSINWNQFSIDQGSKVTFVQPNASSIALNRVTGNMPSQISGQLLANGQVWILNPNGVFINSTGQINTASFLASTHQLTDQNFQNGNYRFIDGGVANALVSNQGSIIVADGGYAVLAGRAVRNDGYIQANMGNVVLAGAQSMAIDLLGNRLISFAVGDAVTQASDDGLALVNNTGTIRANGGQVLLTAKAASDIIHQVINTEGVIEAKTAQNVNGQIILDGGVVGQVTLSGTLEASGLAANQTGGLIKVFGNQINVNGNAMLNASGDVGGGTIWVGGGPQGAGVGTGFAYMPALTTYLSSQSVLNASAITNGHGGTIAVWSDVANPLSVTQAYGTLLAMGGSQGGNGGWIETSGHTLNVNGINVNTSAPRGTTGTWLLDPNYFEIVAGNVSSFASSLNGTDIIISSNNTGSNSAGASGDINFGSDVVLDNSTSTHKLTLNASGNINLGLNAGINLPLGFVVLSPYLNVGSDQPSGTGVVRMLNGSRINANTLTVGGNGIVIESATATSTAIAAIIATNTFSVSGLSGGIGLNTLNLTGKLFDVGIANSTMNVNVALQNSSSVLGFSNSDNPVSVSGVISGPGALVKSGTQILTINSQNSFSGGTTLSAGTILVKSNSALGAVTGSVTFAGGTLELAVSDSEGGATGSTPSSRPSVLQSGTNSTLLIDPGVVHENSAITSGTGGLTIINNGLFTKSGKFSEASSITVKGSGVTTFSGINTYTGPTNIIGGNLALAGSGSITNSPLSISNGVFSIRNASAGVTIKSLSGSGIFDVGTTALTITGASSGYTGSFIYGSGSVLATATTPTATTTARVSETQTAQIQQILATSIPRVNIVVPPPPPPPPPPQASVVSVASPPPPPPTSSAPVPPPSSASNAPVPPPSSSASNVPPPPPSSSASNVPGPTNAPPPPPTLVSANLAPPPVVNVSPTFTATSVPSAGPTSIAAAPTSPVAETPPPPQLTSAAVPLDTPAPKDSGTKSSSIKDDGGKKDDGAKDDGSKQSGSNLILAKTSGSADGGSKEPAPTRKATIVRNVPVTNGVVVQTSSRARIENINPMTRSFGLH